MSLCDAEVLLSLGRGQVLPRRVPPALRQLEQRALSRRRRSFVRGGPAEVSLLGVLAQVLQRNVRADESRRGSRPLQGRQARPVVRGQQVQECERLLVRRRVVHDGLQHDAVDVRDECRVVNVNGGREHG